ncbi:MAG: serine hydrolase, partial [Accumulibacter sp.]|uniref:serine hydrolase n=1 Tax=Accumulibacter sp. TaxID=2053492 RepID=UPI0033159FA4
MRITLRTAVLLGAVVGTMLIPMESVQAAEKGKGKITSQKGAVTPVAQKGKVEAAAPKSAAKTAAVQKGNREVVAQRGAAKAVADRGRVEPVARKGKAHRDPPAAVARSDKTTPRATTRGSAHVAQGSRYAPHEAGLIQKRNLTRVFASHADLWQEPGHLAVQSGSALVIGQDGGEPFYEKNANAVVPIASITKLMTAMVVLDSMPNLQAPITISDEDVDYLRGSRSRLQVGSVLPRETALLLALMSSENRAANALGRHYPGGLQAFVAAMNRKAMSLGMTSSHFEDPTGLNSNNVSTAHDLARMVAAAHRYPLIREFSTTPGVRAEVKGRDLDFHNTNQLVSSPTWEIGLSKTGYIQEAGKCLVMQARVAD